MFWVVPAVVHDQVERAYRRSICQHRRDGGRFGLRPGIQPTAGGLYVGAELVGARGVDLDEGHRRVREKALPQLQGGRLVWWRSGQRGKGPLGTPPCMP